MGNAVIAGILFQPPTPPKALDYLGPPGGGVDKGKANNKTVQAKRRAQNVSVDYLWLYSVDGGGSDGGGEGGNLIPAIHITHNDAPPNGLNGKGLGIGGQCGAASSKRYTLLYSHGNAEDLGLISSFLTDLARLLQVNVLCYDYSGYGVGVDEKCVAEFYKGFGKELNDWRTWRVGGKGRIGSGLRGDRHDEEAMRGSVTAINGKRCRYSRDLFVAPFVHPPPGEDDKDDEEDKENSKDGEARDEGGGLDLAKLADACSACTPDSAIPSEDDARASLIDGMDADDNRSGSSAAAYRRKLFARHSWTAPSPSEAGCYRDVSGAYAYLTDVEGVLPRHVLLYGKSVGSGPTCWLAQRLCREDGEGGGGGGGREDEGEREDSARRGSSARDILEGVGGWAGNYDMCRGGGYDGGDEMREPTQEAVTNDGRPDGDGTREGRIATSTAPGGVVLHSPFMSVIRVVLDVGFTTPGDLFPNVDRVGDFTCPVYVIHGSNDAIVPFYHGQRLFQSLPDTCKTVPFWARGAGHNNIEMDMPTAYIKRLQQFVRQCDRLNYPGQVSDRRARILQQQQRDAAHQRQRQMLLQASLEASLRQSMLQQAQHMQHTNKLLQVLPKARMARYASQDSYHPAMMMAAAAAAQQQGAAVGPAVPSSPSGRASKQRKQRGTLVMKSAPHPPSPGRTPAAAVPPPPPPATAEQHPHSSAGGRSPRVRSGGYVAALQARERQEVMRHGAEGRRAAAEVYQHHRSTSVPAPGGVGRGLQFPLRGGYAVLPSRGEGAHASARSAASGFRDI